MEGPGGPDRPAAGGRPAPRRAVGMAAVTRRADGERSAALTTGLLPEGLVHGVGARGAVSDWTTGLNRGKTAGTGPVCRSSGRSRGSGRHNRALTPRLSPLSTLPERRADRQRRGRGRRRPPWTQRARPQGAWKPQRTRFPQRPQPSSSSRSRSARKDRRRSRASRQASRIRQFFTTLDSKVVKTVEVAAQALLENPQHQDRPKGHPRTPDRMVHLRLNMLLQQREQPCPKRLLRPDVLKPFQHRRDVVPRLGVEPDLLDWHLAEPELSSVNVSHGGRCREDLAGRRTTTQNHGQEYDIPAIFAT